MDGNGDPIEDTLSKINDLIAAATSMSLPVTLKATNDLRLVLETVPRDGADTSC